MAPRRRSGSSLDETVLRYAAGVMIGFLVVGTALVVASKALDSSADRPAAARRTTDAAAAPTAGASASASSTADASPSSTASAAPRMTGAAMTRFLRRYLTTVTDDPAAGWRLLTAGFQRASGGFASYRAFWAPIDTATPFGVFAQPGPRRITYRVRYAYSDGRVLVDSTRLELVLTRGGGYRIDGEG